MPARVCYIICSNRAMEVNMLIGLVVVAVLVVGNVALANVGTYKTPR